jgi:copper chaperone NosL
MIRTMSILVAALALPACSRSEATSVPAPVAMTEDALGYYCQMHVMEHPGPKAQIHLEGVREPLFFSQVRDAVAYQRMPEQSYSIRAIYVSDMAAAPSWEEPGADNWAVAEAAHYVIDADITGGMGAPELVPFSTREAAESFVRRHGGSIARLDEIPDEAVLTPVEFDVDEDGNFVPLEHGDMHG